MSGTILRVHFIGICGTAMGAVAVGMKEQGWIVTGSDNQAYPPMSDFLAARGIDVCAGFSPENLPKEEALIVVGNAISRGNPEVEAVLNRKLNYASLPEVLRAHFLRGRHNIVVAGTHGKTTTTSITAWILEHAGKNPSYLIGGLPANLGQGACLRDPATSRHFVIEGDEYDTAFFDKRSKFIQYLPHVLAINNCEFDHADIFRDLEDVLRTFSHVIRIVPRDGAIVANGDDPNVLGLVKNVTWAPVVRVGTGSTNDAVIADFRESPTGSSFTLVWKGKEWGRVKWALPGLFNARNAAMAAVSAGLLLDAKDPTKLKLDSLSKFQGVQRRQQVLVDRPDLTVIEDFGHHPTALDLTLESLRARYPQHRLVACFEPRSNTAARKVMQDAFREALKKADEVFLAPPHRADKLGEERFDSEGVAAAITAVGKKGFAPASNDALLAELTALVKSDKSPRCVIFFSNGAFGGIIKKFAQGA